MNIWCAILLASSGIWYGVGCGVMAAYCGLLTYCPRYQIQEDEQEK